MEHHYLDEFADRDSPIHRLEARTKVLCTLALILSAVLVPEELNWPFAVYLALLAVLLAASCLPLAHVLKRAAAFGPFILTAVLLVPFTRRGDGGVAWAISLGGINLRVYQAGLVTAKGILVKSLISALSVILLVSTTHFSQLLKALERLRFPHLSLTVISFLYRYLFLLMGELLRLLRAARARNWEAGRWRQRIKTAGGIVGSLFLRTYDRAERVHMAMLSRGYDAGIRTLSDTIMAVRDYLFLGAFLTVVVGVAVLALVLR